MLPLLPIFICVINDDRSICPSDVVGAGSVVSRGSVVVAVPWVVAVVEVEASVSTLLRLLLLL